MAPIVVIFVVGGITGGELAMVRRITTKAVRREGGLDMRAGLGDESESTATQRLLIGGTCIASPATIASALLRND
jgi:hypothetical protein